MALWNTNRFDDIRLESETGERGGVILRFVVVERPVVRDIKYEGLKSASTSDVLDRFKERKVGLVVESMYDPNVVNHASVVLKDLLGERGVGCTVVELKTAANGANARVELRLSCQRALVLVNEDDETKLSVCPA